MKFAILSVLLKIWDVLREKCISGKTFLIEFSTYEVIIEMSRYHSSGSTGLRIDFRIFAVLLKTEMHFLRKRFDFTEYLVSVKRSDFSKIEKYQISGMILPSPGRSSSSGSVTFNHILREMFWEYFSDKALFLSFEIRNSSGLV